MILFFGGAGGQGEWARVNDFFSKNPNGGVWGARVSEFFFKESKSKKRKNIFFFFFFFFLGGGGGAGAGGGALEELNFFYKESKFKTFFLAGGEGLGDWEARVREFFLLSIHS